MFVHSHFLIDHVHLVFAAIVILEVKHFICDFVLQTAYQYMNKGIYGHPGGILHSGLHALFSLSIFIILTPAWGLACAMIAGEFIVHYHCDWTKEWILRQTHWKFPEQKYWWIFGLDQLVHHVTYLVMIAVLIWGLNFQ
jgi:Protein of unknown function (DUF3307)